jgi:hypothetical protein
MAELDGPEVAWVILDRLAEALAAYHATRADLLRRLGKSQQLRAAYDRAIELAGNTGETAYLTRRRDPRPVLCPEIPESRTPTPMQTPSRPAGLFRFGVVLCLCTALGSVLAVSGPPLG